MSNRQRQIVWDASGQKGSKLLLLLAIAEHADPSGYCYPGVPRLANLTRLAERHITRLIGDLNKTEEIAVSYRTGPGGANEYYLLLEKTPTQITLTKADCRKRSKHPTPDKLAPTTPDKLAPLPANLSQRGDIVASGEPLEPINSEVMELWNRALDQLSGSMLQHTYNNLFLGSELAINGDIATIHTRNERAAVWINARMLPSVTAVLEEFTKNQYTITAEVKKGA